MGIEFEGLNQEITTPSLSTGTSFTTALAKAAFDTRVAWRFQNAEQRSRYARLGNVVLDALDTKISALEQAVARFDWPASGSVLRGARLVSPANADDSLSGKLTAEIRTGDDVVSYYKFFSRGRPSYRDTDLDGASYSFSVTQNGVTETASITIPSGETWGDILTRVADAVNGLDLPVQAEVIDQTGAYQNLDFLPKVGKILAIAVDSGIAAQDIDLADESGHLLLNLDMEETTAPVGPTPEMRYQVSQYSPQRTATFISDQLNPVAAHGLTAGVHKIRITVGDLSAIVSVNVTDDMDNEDLLIATANSINSTSTELRATVKDGEMSSGLLNPVMQRSRYLEVTLAQPKLGDRLAMEEYGGPWLDDVDGFHDPTTLPTWVTGGERYIATATANGWTAGRVYEYDGAAWQETTPVATNAVNSKDDGADYFYDGSSWSTTSSGSLVETLGLSGTAQPGADATAVVNGVSMRSATGEFTLDEGRVGIAVDSLAGEGAGVPLSVVEGMNEVRKRFTDIVTTYNDLRSYILSNADLFEAGFADTWKDPVDDLGTELEWMGVNQMSKSGALWVDNDAFWKALGQDQNRAKAVLYDAPDGLAPALSTASSEARGGGLSGRLIQPELMADTGPPISQEIALRERTMLQDVIDAASTAPQPLKNPYLETSGLLEKIAEAKRVASARLSSLDEGGSILKSST